jgi:predicted AAA+ superfamily ATPase
LFFYRTHHGAEADLVITRGNSGRAALEIKFTNSPKLTKGNFIAFEDLNAPTNFVITPSSDDYLVKPNIRVCSKNDFIFNYLQKI